MYAIRSYYGKINPADITAGDANGLHHPNLPCVLFEGRQNGKTQAENGDEHDQEAA